MQEGEKESARRCCLVALLVALSLEDRPQLEPLSDL